MEERDQNGYLERGGAVRAAPELRGGGWSEQCRTMEARHAALSGWHLSSCTKHTLQMLCQIEVDGTHSEESTRNDQILLAHLPSMYCTCLRCTALAFDVLLQYIEGCGFHLTIKNVRSPFSCDGSRRTHRADFPVSWVVVETFCSSTPHE